MNKNLKINQNLNSSRYMNFTEKAEAHKAFNSLKGIVDGIAFDLSVNDKEIKELDLWCQKHEFLSTTNPFSDIIINIQAITEDGIVTLEEIEDMRWLCDKFSDGFSYYDEFTSDLQVLQGLCHGILADGRVRDEEVIQLNHWLEQNKHLASYYPYDEICSLMAEVLADGKVDESEKILLKKYFNEFTNLNDAELQETINSDTDHVKIGGICAVDPEIDFDGKYFCFTGHSDRSSRAVIAEIIEKLGGIYHNSVIKKTDYLIVGDDGNPCWAYACYGRKVEKAIKLRKDGSHILIVHENDLWDQFEDWGYSS